MRARVFFDSHPDYSCTRIEVLSVEDGNFSDLPPTAENARVIDTAEIPNDRTFRAAWNPDFSIDMAKAREIQRDRIREMRAPVLVELDIAYQRADEQGDAEAKAAIAARKQVLRDATRDPAIDAAKTPEELKEAIPDVLKD